MNQIICTPNSNIKFKNINFIRKKILIIYLYLLIFICLSLTIYYIYFKYNIFQNEKISQNLLYNFNITSIYSNFQDYSNSTSNKDISKGLSKSTIGAIEIKKIGISYPILSELDNNSLKISPCRFYGPLPNQIGNLCIAAHNYKNGSFFSNLSNLVNGDIITIYDINGHPLDYLVYKIYTSNAKDTECMNQNTNNQKIITLVTCDSNNNAFRTIVKAKEFHI